MPQDCQTSKQTLKGEKNLAVVFDSELIEHLTGRATLNGDGSSYSLVQTSAWNLSNVGRTTLSTYTLLFCHFTK